MQNKKTTLIRQSLACLTVFACIYASGESLHAQKFSENEVKSAFLYKVTKFIRWGNNSNIVFCTIGEEDDTSIKISQAFSAITKGKKPPFTIKPNIALNKIDKCNILYIDQSNSNNLKNIFSLTAGKPIVTVSGIKSFSRRGGMFGFITDSNGRIKLELNKGNAEISNVDIKSSLLEIINIVD